MKTGKINDLKQLRKLIQEVMGENPNLLSASASTPAINPEDADDVNFNEESIKSPEELISRIKDLISDYESSQENRLDSSDMSDEII